MKKQNFITGAIILMIANAISKILGAVFKIPLTYIIGEEGMAIYNTAFNIYIMFLSFIISGLPFAISKLVSEYSAKKEYQMMRYTVKISSVLLVAAGIIGSVVLFFGAKFFAYAMKEEKAIFAIRMIATSIFFVAMGTSVRSYYQGISNMIPTAVSQVTEAVTKLVAGYLIAAHLIGYGIEYAAGGALLGVTIGELIATAVFVGIYFFEKKEKISYKGLDKRKILKALFEIALPLLFASVVSSMLSVVETTVVRSQLITHFRDIDEARRVYGSYTGYALTVFHLPVGILSTLGVSILPIIAGSIATGNTEKAKRASQLAIKFTLLISLPCAVFIYYLSDEALYILFHNTSSSKMLMMLSPCLIMICLSNIIASILQSSGEILSSFSYSVIGTIIKLILCVFLIDDYGIYGAITGANIGCFVTLILNIIKIRKKLGLKFKIMEMIIKPAAAAALMCIMICMIKKPLEEYINSVSIKTLIICAAAVLGYIFMLILSNALDLDFKVLKKKEKGDIIQKTA